MVSTCMLGEGEPIGPEVPEPDPIRASHCMQLLVVSADEEGRTVGRDGTAGLDAIWQLRAPNFGTGREANRSQPAGVGAHEG